MEQELRIKREQEDKVRKEREILQTRAMEAQKWEARHRMEKERYSQKASQYERCQQTYKAEMHRFVQITEVTIKKHGLKRHHLVSRQHSDNGLHLGKASYGRKMRYQEISNCFN